MSSIVATARDAAGDHGVEPCIEAVDAAAEVQSLACGGSRRRGTRRSDDS